MKVSRIAEMQDLDHKAASLFGISEDLLMENAGLASCQAVNEEFGIAGRRFLIICGIGNNGGDGLVVARKIHSMGGVSGSFSWAIPVSSKGPLKTITPSSTNWAWTPSFTKAGKTSLAAWCMR